MVCHFGVPFSVSSVPPSSGYLFKLLGVRSTCVYQNGSCEVIGYSRYGTQRSIQSVSNPNMECCYRPCSTITLSSSCFRDRYLEAHASSTRILMRMIGDSWEHGGETNFVLCAIVDNSYPRAMPTSTALVLRYSEKIVLSLLGSRFLSI